MMAYLVASLAAASLITHAPLASAAFGFSPPCSAVTPLQQPDAAGVPATPTSPSPAAPTSPSPAEPESAPPPSANMEHWCGWQTLSVDAAAATLGFVGLATQNSSEKFAGVAGYSGLTAYLLAPPVIHAFHGHAGKAAASFGLRLGMPVLFVLAGVKGVNGSHCPARSEGEDSSYCQLDNYGWWAFAGASVAAVIDGLAIAREPVVSTAPALPMPFVAPGPHGAMVFGLSGRL